MSRVRASLARIAAIARKELRHLRRDRLTGGMVAGVPLMMTLLFGYAINQDVRHLRAGVADLSGTQRARWLVAGRAGHAGDRRRGAARARCRSSSSMLRAGEISVGIAIPPDFERRRDRRRPARARSSWSTAAIRSCWPPCAGSLALPLERRVARAARDAAAPQAFELRAYYNPERRSPVHIVPALCGVILTLTLVLFTAVAIVRERERGNLELLITTPVQTPELMVGKIAPYVAIGYAAGHADPLARALALRRADRGVAARACTSRPARSSRPRSRSGLLISTVAQTQFQAFQMAFVSFLPQILLSGFMFPFDGMPAPARWLAEVLPLTHFLRIVRGIVLRGATLGDVRGEIEALLIFFSVAFTLAVLRFRKRLD